VKILNRVNEVDHSYGSRMQEILGE
jgi:hypothetical protein